MLLVVIYDLTDACERLDQLELMAKVKLAKIAEEGMGLLSGLNN